MVQAARPGGVPSAPVRLSPPAATPDSLERTKRLFKRAPRLYRFIVRVLSPVLPISNDLPREVLSGLPSGALVLNLGSGPVPLHPVFVDVDAHPYPNVRVVSDCARLPFNDGAADAMVSIALLEHVEDPWRVVAEMRRVLKPGGRLYVYVPFICGYHAAPADFHRWTRSGAERLFKGFDVLETRSAGPTSGFLWVLVEWLAILLSFGSRKLYVAWLIALMLSTWPIKYLDLVLRRHPMSDRISTGFLYVLKSSSDDVAKAELAATVHSAT